MGLVENTREFLKSIPDDPQLFFGEKTGQWEIVESDDTNLWIAQCLYHPSPRMGNTKIQRRFAQMYLHRGQGELFFLNTRKKPEDTRSLVQASQCQVVVSQDTVGFVKNDIFLGKSIDNACIRERIRIVYGDEGQWDEVSVAKPDGNHLLRIAYAVGRITGLTGEKARTVACAPSGRIDPARDIKLRVMPRGEDGEIEISIQKWARKNGESQVPFICRLGKYPYLIAGPEGIAELVKREIRTRAGDII